MGLRSESDRRSVDNERRRFERECATPKDDWEGNEKGYIKYLADGFSYDRDKDGNLIKLRGEAAVRKELENHLDNPDCYSYNHAKGRGYYDWMLLVREKFEKMVRKDKFKPVDYEKKEQEDREYWKRYYDNHPQFSRPKGI
jgi:hypothetical protein